MYCQNCGKPLEPNAVFCSNCGAKVVGIFGSTCGEILTDTVIQQKKTKSYYGFPLLLNGILAAICSLVMILWNTETKRYGSILYWENKLYGYSEYSKLCDILDMAFNTCKIWAIIGVVLVIAGIALFIRKPKRENILVKILLWVFPLLGTIFIIVFSVIAINNVAAY